MSTKQSKLTNKHLILMALFPLRHIHIRDGYKTKEAVAYA